MPGGDEGATVSFAERMLKIDRRIIFLVIGLCTLLPLLYGWFADHDFAGGPRGVRLHRVAP
jgi:hypothetical protein